jgi:hypothetical protein
VAKGRPGNPNWVKGVSGNPSGRPRVVADIQELARQHGPDAILTLVEALKDPKHKVAAAIALLDRGYGKPVQSLTLNHNLPASTVADAALAVIALGGSGVAAASPDDTEGSEGLVH